MNTIYYLRSILVNLNSLRNVVEHERPQPSLVGEVLNDNIDWLKGYIEQLEEEKKENENNTIPF